MEQYKKQGAISGESGAYSALLRKFKPAMKNIMLLKNKILNFTIILVAISGIALSGCNSTSDDGTQGKKELTLQFKTKADSPVTSKLSANQIQEADSSLVIEGSNGTLIINDLRFVVEEIELERADGDFEDFEAGPFFVNLPLNGDAFSLDKVEIETGLYKELEFEIDDFDFDEEESDDNSYKQQVLTHIRTEFPDWPKDASMVISGKFVTADGIETNFKTYAEAEVEIELEFKPPFELTAESANDLISVNINPALWFLRANGTVVNLSEYDFETTSKLFEFEIEIENGFMSIDIDEDD